MSEALAAQAQAASDEKIAKQQAEAEAALAARRAERQAEAERVAALQKAAADREREIAANQERPSGGFGPDHSCCVRRDGSTTCTS